jgi:pilus assembly protein CpaC
MGIFFILFILFSTNLFAEELRLSVGEIRRLHFPNLKKIENSNPKLIRAQIFPEKDEIAISALSKGNGRIAVKDQFGNHTIDVLVYSKLALDLEREIKELTRDIEGIEVKQAGHQVVISGHIMTSEDLERLQKIEKRYEDKLINLTDPLPSAKTTPLEKMIEIDVRMVELNKNRLRAIGIQFPELINTRFAIRQNFTPYTIAAGANSEFDLIIRAIEKKGWAKVMANPKLVCKNGGEAHFMAGGEIPIRLAHRGSLSVQWKPYGILLHILPKADAENQISTTLKIEISTLNSGTSVEGIPGLLTRKLETSLNVKSGETIALSGLIHHQDGDASHRVPIVSGIPILGALFEAREFKSENTELMIYVTPAVKEVMNENHSDSN